MKHSHTFVWKLLYVSVILLLISLTISVAQAADSGWRNPTANAVFTTGFTTPDGAYTDGGAYAYRDNNANGVAHVYSGYDFSSIPANAGIAGIEVQLNWWLDSFSGNNEIRVYLSGDGGTSWTAYQAANNESTNTNNTETVGAANDRWGRRWLPSELSAANFRVRLELSTDRTDRDFRIDWAPVRVTYFTPHAAPTTPVQIEPANGGVVISGTPTFSWNPSTDLYGDPITYAISIDSGAFIDAGAATQYIPGTAFANGSSHTWQVRACDDRGTCTTSGTAWSFTVNTDIVGPNQDAYVDQDGNNANVNYGADQYLYLRSDRVSGGVAQNRRTFLRFNMPAITSCYAGTSPSIVQATVRLYADQGPSILRTYQVFRVTQSWIESGAGGITWNNQASVAGSATDSSNVIANYTGWVDWDVTSDLQNFVDYGGSNTNYGWMLKDADETQATTYYQTRFRSKEYTGSSYDPQLIIAYNCPPSAPVLVSPTNGAFLASNTPLLDWNPATDPNAADTLTYAVRVSTSGIWGAWNTSPGTATQFTTPILSEGYHEWQVRVSDGRAETLSDIWGFTIDTDTPATPGYLYEGLPDQDYYASTNYSLLINWGSVADTGSGISYRLERRVNGGAFTLVTTTTTTSYLDTGTFANNDFIEYQVRAQTGAGTPSAWQTSDGVRIDAQTLPQVTGVGEGVSAGTDDDWSRNNVYFVYWNIVTSTGSPVTYEVQRSVNGGAWETFTPAAQTCDAVRCWGDDLVGHANGDEIRYRVRAVNGAGSQGAWSAESDGIIIDTILPDSSVTTGGLYGLGTWPGSIGGVASDAGSGVARVDIRILDTNTNQYWNGTAWTATATFVQATGSTAWSYTFPAANLTDGRTYVVESRATDVAGNVETSFGTNSFTYSGSLPAAPTPTASPHINPALWYNNNQPTFQWNIPAGGPIIEYSFMLDQVDGAIPNTTGDGNVTSYAPGTTADGIWYFHVRARNAAGWGPPGQVRVNIDTTAPPIPTSVTEENPDIDVHVGGSVTVYWTAVSDASPVTYSLDRCVNGGLSGTCTTTWASVATGITATQYDDTIGTTDGTTIRYRVRATDSVSLTSATWRESDGLTIDSQTPATPAGVFEDATSEPDRDWHNSAAGAVTVRWTSVANTGSGITYRLEKELNNSGIWTPVANGLTATSYPDSGAYGDGDRITYRVTAINGVGLEGAPRASDGFVIDTGVPARSDWVREENPDVDFDGDGIFTVYWNVVASTGSPISYMLEKSVDGGSVWTLVANNISGTSQSVAESDPDGTTIFYRVTATNSAGSSGPARLSDGITLDRDTPSAPASVTESSPDVDFDDDGALRVFWTAVLNTGSGITYELQKQVTPPGGPAGGWTTIANNLLTTNYDDTATFPDETFIQYRVIAYNGVGRNSGATLSDGVRVDTNSPSTPTNVGEGDVAGIDDDYDENNVFFVYWTGVAPTATGDQISYTVERNINGGGWITAGSQLPCGGTPCQWDDPAAFSNGDFIQYRVTAVNSAGRAGVPSLVSDGIRIDTTQPDSTVLTNGFYTSFNWPGLVVGTASDAGGSGVAFVDIQIRRRSDSLYWNGTTWGATLTWLRVDGRDNWQYGLDITALTDGVTYDVQSQATDNAGNVEAVPGTNFFTFSNSGPDTPVVSSTTHPVETNWYNNNTPTFNWTTPAGGGGLQVTGYSYILDQSATTLPDTTIDAVINTVSYTGLPDGTYYFHVRAVNSANNWGSAAHFRINIDRDTPAAPASVTEENPDVDLDADGSVTVYWSAVTDTGSGITYRLERNLNNGGFVLVPGAGALTTTSFTVGGFANGDSIVFRVQATNGVSLSSGWTQSDGVTIDTNVPGTPTNVGEGDVVGTDDDWDQDNTFFVYWTAVPNLPSGISYTIERNRNSGGTWEQIATGLACGGTPCRWEDPTSYSTGESVAYRVTAVSGAGRSGSASTPSDGLSLDFALPDSLVTTNGFYNNTTWSGMVVGTSSDVGSGVVFVDITVRRQSDNLYWNGTTWVAGLTWLRTTGTTNWQYGLSVTALTDGVTYDVQSQATDNAGNVEGAPGANSFTYSGSGPGLPVVSSTTHPVETNWYNNNTPTFNWTTPTGGGLTVTGYSYILDQSATTLPDTTIDTTGNTASYTGLPDGTYYFHVRAVNSANNWGPAAHFRINIDRDTPAAPASVTEENPDVDLDADGNLTVYWSAVADTGSGITYRLERNLNNGGFGLVPGADALTTTSFAVGGFVNGDNIIFRVRASNGVPLTSGWTTSDGVTIDTNVPGTPTNVGEGDVVGTDDDWDQDNTFFVYWTGVSNLPSGISYTIERSRNSGPFEVVATNITITSWDDPTAYATGESVAYRVTAVSGAGRSGSASTPSDGLTLDFALPNSLVTTSGFFNSFNWPNSVIGTSSDVGSGVAYVDIQIQRRSDSLYWNGTTWVAGLTWLRTTGTANWQYSLALAALTDGVTYDVRSRATDIASNIQVILGTNFFTFSGTGPGVPVVSSTTHPVQTNWYNNNAPALSWTAPAGGVAIVGYSYTLDQLAGTTPDQSPEGTGTTASYTGLVDGTWYFHVRAVDSANNWGPAAHFRINIDRDTPAAPASVTEENPDVDLDADGNLTVYWSAVADTGSGITYRLERNLNNGGFGLVPGADALTTTSFAVGGFVNGDNIIFRVRTSNAVPLTSGWTTSDGVTIDTNVPGTPTNVGEGDVVGTDDDWDQDNTFFVYWTGVPTLPSGISYTIERSRNSGPFEVVATNITTTSWDDPTAYATGESVAYRVTAVSGAGRSGSASTPSDGLTLDFVRPDSVVETSGFYNAVTWPGFIAGTATDDLSDVAFVDITVRRQSDSLYWNGATWVAALTWLRTTGTANWQYTFAPEDGIAYDVQSRATDIAGNVETTFGANTFRYINNELGIIVNDGRDTVQPGELITYTINFTSSTNLLPGLVEIDIPANSIFVSASPGFINNTTSIGWLVTGFTGQRSLVVQVLPVMDNGTIISTTARVSGNGQTNQDSESATVVSQPNLSNSVKTVSNPGARAGSLVTYQIVLSNTGNMHAHNTVITDSIPAGVSYTGTVTASVGIPTYAGGVIGWQGEVQAETPVTIQFTAQVDANVTEGQVIENVVEINDGFHPNLVQKNATISVGSQAPSKGQVYLPLIMIGSGTNSAPPAGPEIELTIRNCGSVNALGAFWVDLYFNPNEQSVFWPINHGEGYDWFGQGAAFAVSSLGPGQSVNLYLANATLKNMPSTLPNSARLYAQVDTFDSDNGPSGPGVVDEGTAGEANNIASVNGSTCNATAGKPDLIVESIRLIGTSAAATSTTKMAPVEGAAAAPTRLQPPQK